MDNVVATAEIASSLSGRPYTAMKIVKDTWAQVTCSIVVCCYNPTRHTMPKSGRLTTFHIPLLVAAGWAGWRTCGCVEWAGVLSGRVC